jgi:hypothetical protein
LNYSLYKNEYRIFKPVETTIRKGLRYKEEKQKCTILGYNTYIHGSAQGKSLCSYLKHEKCHYFSFTKLENRRAESVILGWGLVPA